MTNRLVIYGQTLAVPAIVVCSACAPVAMLPTLAPMTADRPNEFGIAGTAAYSEVDGDEPPGCWDTTSCSSGGVALYYYRSLGVAGGLGIVGYAGSATLGGGGLLIRVHPVHSDNLVVSVQAEGGWLWFGAGLPVAMRVGPSTWVHIAPNVDLGMQQIVELPIGVTYAGKKGLTVAGEVAGMWGTVDLPGGFAPSGGPSFSSHWIRSARATITLAYRF